MTETSHSCPLCWTDPDWLPLSGLWWLDLCPGCGAWDAEHCIRPECDLHIVLGCHGEHEETG